ncbi:sensor histidine kinase [Agromyces intestinalis]|uniref:Sensor histidine kinase n=1 Tax=Agromyces intestinalis TaxID=2592652 RepID=A0A5C1YBE4_9MICO|nr:sensor histidine kinase [Agromyces intestinalis]QEO13331.1 sensor histidine kinase [Agromyces intestinalis]
MADATVIRSGPTWPILPASMAATGRASVAASLRSRAAVSWYVGAGISLLWLATLVEDVVGASRGPASAAIGVALVVVYGLAFLVAGPTVWALPVRGRLLVVAGLWAYTFVFTPWVGWAIGGTWTYVGVLIGVCVLDWRLTWKLVFGLGALAVVTGYLAYGPVQDIFFAPAITVSISAMMAAFARNLASMNQLRAAQAELERMAVEQERGRVARDIHDILGHSLTVITVKAELARKLVEVDAERAGREIGEVEDLARGALADVRATVAGFRGVSVSGELAGARTALEAADIVADLPVSTEQVPAGFRELAGWVVREGVTNVIRHASARTCRVRLDAHGIEVADDGVGPSAGAEGAGGAAFDTANASNGLRGLRERVESAGARLSIGRSDLGGFSLRVAW